VFFFKQVKHRLYRIKGDVRDLNEYRIPVSHTTVPKTRKLQRLKLFTIHRFDRNKAGVGVGKIQETKWYSKVVTNPAYKINRIKMR